MDPLIPILAAFALNLTTVVAVVYVGYVKFKTTTDITVSSMEKGQVENTAALRECTMELKEFGNKLSTLELQVTSFRVEDRLKRLEDVVLKKD